MRLREQNGFLSSNEGDSGSAEAYSTFTLKPGTVVPEYERMNDEKVEQDLRISGSGANTDLFKFLADNTKVEWGYSYNGDGTNGGGHLNTSHLEGNVHAEFKKDYDNFVHSHPNATKKDKLFSLKDLEVYEHVLMKEDRNDSRVYDYENVGIYRPKDKVLTMEELKYVIR